MAKKRKAASNRASRKRPARRRASADQTVNTLVILVVIVIVLGGLYLYARAEQYDEVRTFAVERIEKIEVMARGRVRRARLFYLRDLAGKAARIKERSGISAALIAPTVPSDQLPPEQ